MDGRVAVTLFRHGLTEVNERKAYLGWSDSPLTAAGIAALNELSGKLDPYDQLFSSDLGRSTATASILFPNQECRVSSSLREMNFGRWEGRTYEELKQEKAYLEWLEDPLKMNIPEGESYPVFSARVKKAWEQMVKEDFRNLAVVSHGGVIRELLTHYAPYEQSFWDWLIPHHKGFRLLWPDRESIRRGERCTSLRAVPIMERQDG
ncbi:histidine phosphatase family protein [Bacillus massiliglaciei]|uniref:histidine phosphatase family protein n=1 Tax=Bacillus massiliglaciei TaxID=1816693 RepID=UPI000DA6354F|nr:histidine phosphatase family protein [Bacillus massiliglaciei]